jgi:alpha-beta hydrolase superfamily lysophospholipase
VKKEVSRVTIPADLEDIYLIAREPVTQPLSKPSRLTELLIRLGLASGIGTLAAQYLIARWLTKPTRERIIQTPSVLGLDWEPFACRTHDGYRLRGWVVTPSRPRATILLFHGIRNTRTQMFSRLAFLVPAGYRCVAIDHRAHGESDGRRSSFGYHEQHDVRAVLAQARRQWPDQPLAALGLSMGAAALCYAASDVRQAARAVILESLYHDVVTAFQNRLAAGHYPGYFHRLTRGVIRRCERRIGVLAQQLAPANFIAGLAPVPLLILTGSEDRHSTPDEAERLFSRRNGPGELLLVPGAGHADVCETGGEFYRGELLNFLDRSLFGEPEA